MNASELEFHNSFSIDLYKKTEVIRKTIRRKKVEKSVSVWSPSFKGEYGSVEEAAIKVLSSEGGCTQEGAALKLMIAVTALPLSRWPDKRAIHGYLFPQTIFGASGEMRGLDQSELLEGIHSTSSCSALETLDYIENRKGFREFHRAISAAKQMLDKVDRNILVELTNRAFLRRPALHTGWPDLTFIKNCKVELVEVKSPNDRLRPSQAEIAKSFRNIDGIKTSLATVKVVNLD